MAGKPVLATVYRPDILADKASDRFVEFDALARIGLRSTRWLRLKLIVTVWRVLRALHHAKPALVCARPVRVCQLMKISCESNTPGLQ